MRPKRYEAAGCQFTGSSGRRSSWFDIRGKRLAGAARNHVTGLVRGSDTR